MLFSPGTTDVHPNVRLVMDGHLKLESGDIQAIAETFAHDIVWHEFGSTRLSGSHRGIADVVSYWQVYFAAAGSGFRQDITEIMANDDFVTSIVRLTGEKRGLTFAQDAVDIMRMEGNKIAEFWRYYADIDAAHRFLLAEC
jgi:ketosteroid isomerase-like protein